MPDKAIVNTSPIIVLAKIQHIHLLRALYRQILIPQAVADEIYARAENDPGRVWLDNEGKNYVGTVGAIDPVIAGWDLGAGESEVLSWAYHNPDFEAIVDDRAARNCALGLRIPIRGTLGLVLLAKEERHIQRVAPILRELVQSGLRLSPEILEEAKRIAGE